MGRKGFTAVELIVSLLIISILMTGVLPTVGVLKSSKDVESELVRAGDEVAVKLGVPVFLMLGRLPESLDELISSGVVTGEAQEAGIRRVPYCDETGIRGRGADTSFSFRSVCSFFSSPMSGSTRIRRCVSKAATSSFSPTVGRRFPERRRAFLGRESIPSGFPTAFGVLRKTKSLRRSYGGPSWKFPAAFRSMFVPVSNGKISSCFPCPDQIERGYVSPNIRRGGRREI